jgi:hypothetical protein
VHLLLPLFETSAKTFPSHLEHNTLSAVVALATAVMYCRTISVIMSRDRLTYKESTDLN